MLKYADEMRLQRIEVDIMEWNEELERKNCNAVAKSGTRKNLHHVLYSTAAVLLNTILQMKCVRNLSL